MKTSSKPNGNNNYKLSANRTQRQKDWSNMSPKKEKNEKNRIISTMCSLQHATQQETMHNNAKLSYHNSQKNAAC